MHVSHWTPELPLDTSSGMTTRGGQATELGGIGRDRVGTRRRRVRPQLQELDGEWGNLLADP
jgi:hypothetical protein